MSDEEAHRLLSSGRTRSLPSIQRVIDRKEKQIAKKKQTGKSKFLVKNVGLSYKWTLVGETGRSNEEKWMVLEPKVYVQTRKKDGPKESLLGRPLSPLWPSTFVQCWVYGV